MITLALIGTGRWGTNIKRTLDDIGGVHVLTADTSATSKKLQQRGDVDAAIIATPGSTHARLALPFIRKGIPTFIEKPMTTNVPDALRLQREAKKTGSLVFVGHVHLYNPAYIKVKELAREAGRIRALMFEGMNNGPYRDDMSALWDWAPHDVAMVLDVLETKPKTVQAWGKCVLRPQTTLYDMAMVKLVFPGEVQVVVNVSWLSPEKRKKMVVIGSQDSIVFDDTARKKITLYRGMGPRLRPARLTGEQGSDGQAHVLKQQPTLSHPRYSKQPPLRRELEAFLQAIKTGTQPITDIDQGVEVVRIIAAAEESIRLDGKLVTL